MTVAALVIAIMALLICVFVALAMIELVAASDTPRSRAVSEDTIHAKEIPKTIAGTAASTHGLPSWIDATPTHLALFLSPLCRQCSQLATSMNGVIPDGVTVVITAADLIRQREWASDHDLAGAEIVFDENRSIADSLGINSSPTVVGFAGGRVLYGAEIGGVPALKELLRQAKLAQQDPEAVRVEFSRIAVAQEGSERDLAYSLGIAVGLISGLVQSRARQHTPLGPGPAFTNLLQQKERIGTERLVLLPYVPIVILVTFVLLSAP